MAFVSDTFTDTDGTQLGDHTGETGATWTSHPAGAYSVHAKIDANRVHSNSALRCYYASGTPASADYDVEAIVRRVTASGNIGIVGRLDTSANTMYLAMWTAGGQWQLYKIVAGTSTQLGSSYNDNPANGTDRTVKLEMRGTAIKVYVDGTEQISVTDSAISAAGRAGWRGNGATASAGFHIDSLTASDSSTTVARSAAIDAATALTSAGAKLATTVSRTAALDATAALAAVPTKVVTRVASHTATTQIATVGREQLARTASVTATTAIATSGQVIAEVITSSAAVTATAAVTTSGHVVKSRTAALSASTAVAASGSLTRLRAAALTATTQIATVGTEMGVTSRSAALTGTTQIVTGAGLIRLRAATLAATAQIATVGTPLAPGVTSRAATLTAATLIATDSGLVRLRSASLAGLTEIASTAAATRYRSASLSATSAIASAWSPLARPAELVVSLSGDALVALDTSSLTTTLDTEATEVELQTA